jgi:hypothetical protein
MRTPSSSISLSAKIGGQSSVIAASSEALYAAIHKPQLPRARSVLRGSQTSAVTQAFLQSQSTAWSSALYAVRRSLLRDSISMFAAPFPADLHQRFSISVFQCFSVFPKDYPTDFARPLQASASHADKSASSRPRRAPTNPAPFEYPLHPPAGAWQNYAAVYGS